MKRPIITFLVVWTVLWAIGAYFGWWLWIWHNAAWVFIIAAILDSIAIVAVGHGANKAAKTRRERQ